VASEKDDLLDPAEIEALLSSAGGGGQTTAPHTAPGVPQGGPFAEPQTSAPSQAPPGEPLSASDIDALLQQRSRAAPSGGPEALLERATADLAAAIAPDFSSAGSIPDRAAAARPFEFQPFDGRPEGAAPGEINNLKDVELNLRIELGRTELLIEEVLKLREGSVVALDKLAGDPVDVLVNGRLVARGEVLVLNDNFCVRIAEILAPAFE